MNNKQNQPQKTNGKPIKQSKQKRVKQPAGEAMEKYKRKCNNQWPKKCRPESKRNQKNINSLLQTLEPTHKKNDCHNNSAELTFYHPQNSIKENPKTPQ